MKREHDASRRAWLGRTAAGLLALGLTGCAQWMGPQGVVFSEAELQALLAKRFPLDRRLLEVLEVRISEPKLGLLPQQDRVSAELKVSATDRLFASELAGELALSTALRVEPSDRSLRLKDVRVTRLSLNQRGQPAAASERSQRLGAAIAERMLEGVVLHQFRAEQWDRLMAAGYATPTVNITSRGLELRAVPAR